MQKENHTPKDKQVYITVAVFYALKQAEKTFQELHLQRKLKGGKAAIIVEKDLRGDLHLQEIGPNAGKGAASGAVLGAVLGVLTGGASLALVALGGVLGGVEGKRAQRCLVERQSVGPNLRGAGARHFGNPDRREQRPARIGSGGAESEWR